MKAMGLRSAASVRHIRLLFRLATAACLLTACADIPVRPADEKAATVAAGFGRAFGRVIYLENGKEFDWSSSVFATDSLTLYVRAVPEGQLQMMQIEGDGSFYWPLQAGDYVIVGYLRMRRQVTNQQRTGRLWTTFTVPRPGQAVYIGDLRIDATNHGFRFEVFDRYAEALPRVQDRLRDGKIEAVNGLMRVDGQLGRYTRVIPICNKAWVLACDSNFQGVEPLQPEGTAQGFPLTASLMPVLEWKPSGKAGVTYDVAIFESLTIPRMRGARVGYAEGLTEPRYTPATALPPGRKFEWSVRLRDGDTVSSWSSTSHFAFLIVAWARGSGQGFGFTTPER